MGTHGEHTPCRLCCDTGRTMLTLTPTPLANNFAEAPDADAARYPLEVMECFKCGHVQLRHQVHIPFDRRYAYATPEAMRPHLADAAAKLRQRYPTARTVLEIGCNNGLYLEELARVGFSVRGIDPSATPSEHVLSMPFTLANADLLSPVDLIVANNVFAHVDDLYDTFQGIDRVLRDDGAVVFEVQYFPALVQRGAFDMIYHEHRDYHTLGPLVSFLRRFGFVIARWEMLDTHGGSVRVYCERPGRAWAVPNEEIDWRDFTRRIEQEREHLTKLIKKAGTVIIFGASAKACTLIHHFGLADKIGFCVDDTPAKQYKFIPGTDIQILPTSKLHNNTVPVLLTAWNYTDYLSERYPDQTFLIPFSHSRQEVCI